MDASRFRTRVTFQTQTRTSDEGGGYEIEWDDSLTVWAEFLPERGRERVEAGRLQAALGATLRIRKSRAAASITENDRVLIHDDPFQIRSIADEGQSNRYLTMTVEKGVAT